MPKDDSYYHLDKRIDSILAIDDGSNGVMSTEQVAVWLGVSAQWLSIRRGKGNGPAWEKVGVGTYNVRYRKEKVRAWLKDRKKLLT
jgi:hypothetical protein